MTRGNQREIDRQRAANRKDRYAPKESRGGNVQQRNESDAAALAAKIAAKKAAKEAAEADGGAAGGK